MTKRVLVADDNPHIREILEGGIRRAVDDCEIETADDGKIALDRVESGDVDLLVLDLYMPNLDGHRVIERARANADLAGLRILVVTAGGEDAVDEAITLGADEALSKPLRLVDVADAVRRLLRLS
jgi:CheY-like chemotaxis protein